MLCSFVSSRLSADALEVYVLDHLFPFSSLLVDSHMAVADLVLGSKCHEIRQICNTMHRHIC